MSASTFFLYLIAAFAVCLGVLVFLRNDKSPINRSFLVLSLAIGAWIMSNVFFVTAPDNNTGYLVALISYASAAATSVAFFLFVATLSGIKIKHTIAWRVMGVLFAGASATPGLLATSVASQTIATTPFILVYAVILAALFTAGITILFRGSRHSRGQRRQQLITVLLGLIGGIVGGVVFNLILPINGDYRFTQIGPAFSILFVGASAYSIIRHRLFDLRGAIVRVATYSLSVLTIAAAYVLVVYLVASPLLVQGGGTTPQWVYVVLAILVALSFQPVKKFFDTATRAIFYKNAYVSQDVIDHLGTLLVREVDVTRLLKRSMQLLNDAIKSSSIEVVLMQGNAQSRVVSLGPPLKHTEELVRIMRRRHEGLLVTDELAEHGGPLHHELATAGVALATPLVTSNATVGFLLIGYKASGGAYTEPDIDLVHIFADELAVAVQNALRYEEIARFNVTLKEEVDDATSQLRDSNRKLHKLDEAKDEFISMASHQLRTPLTSVKGYLSMVLEGDAGNITADQRKLLEEAYSSSQRMVYLIGDFLNVSRLQTGKFMVEAVPTNLASLVREEVEQLQATAARRGITLEYHEPAGFPELMMDDGKIRQVVMNFIDNAIFYSKPNSVVSIELAMGPRDVSLAVHDTGIGVPAAERHHLFTKFFRAANARKVRPDGTGIGLYMAKKVIAAHGGSVIFETKENKGSTFGFRLPIKHETK